jgi:glycosyltransferase involved in cell wall biosynthesis
MAAGLPVVTTAVGGLPEIVRDGVTGYLIPRGKDRSTIVAAFANRLARLLTSPMLRSTMGEAGRKTARADFSAQAAGSTMLNIYEKALAGAKPGPGLDSRRPE